MTTEQNGTYRTDNRGKHMSHNTWDDDRITGHSLVKAEDLAIRAGAEAIHANESLHRHDPSGIVCVYCAINASLAVRAARARDAAAELAERRAEVAS